MKGKEGHPEMGKRPGKDELVKLRHTRALEVDLERRDLNLQVSARDQAGLFTLFEDQRHFFLFCSFFGAPPVVFGGLHPVQCLGLPLGGAQGISVFWTFGIFPHALYFIIFGLFSGSQGDTTLSL